MSLSLLLLFYALNHPWGEKDAVENYIKVAESSK